MKKKKTETTPKLDYRNCVKLQKNIIFLNDLLLLHLKSEFNIIAIIQY